LHRSRRCGADGDRTRETGSVEVWRERHLISRWQNGTGQAVRGLKMTHR
jgi:hypothetical protein